MATVFTLAPIGLPGNHEGITPSSLTQLYIASGQTATITVPAASQGQGVTVYADLRGTVNNTLTPGQNATLNDSASPYYLSPTGDVAVDVSIVGAGYP